MAQIESCSKIATFRCEHYKGVILTLMPSAPFLSLAFLTALMVPVLAQESSPKSGVPVTYQLPTQGPLPRTYRVTLAIVT